MNSRQDFYEKCRTDFTVFTYNSYSYTITDTGIDMAFHFTIEGLKEFEPTWHIDMLPGRNRNINKALLDEMVFSLGMVELVSYWKIVCPRTVIVKGRKLTPAQIGWWKKLYYNGLGEFYYTNGIDESFDDFMNIVCNGSAKESVVCSSSTFSTSRIGHKKPAVMIPIGGGKDSCVTIELLKDKADRFCYIINSRGATDATVEVADLKDKTIHAKRTLDKGMLELNSQGYLNGHTPFSAIVAFSSVIAAYLNDLEFVALSNESSANESTVADSYVNHQYSKSFEFESDFRAYERKHFNSGVYYFSFLRPLSELQIAMLFSRFKPYHSIFKSCNAGSKQDIWCGHCPKCLFVYIILSPFLPLTELDSIFGKRLFEDESLMNDFDKLCGFVPEKPFECVGSRDEVNASIYETIKQYKEANTPLPVLLKHYDDSDAVPNIYFEDYPVKFTSQHALTPFFEDIIKAAIKG